MPAQTLRFLDAQQRHQRTGTRLRQFDRDQVMRAAGNWRRVHDLCCAIGRRYRAECGTAILKLKALERRRLQLLARRINHLATLPPSDRPEAARERARFDAELENIELESFRLAQIVDELVGVWSCDSREFTVNPAGELLAVTRAPGHVRRARFLRQLSKGGTEPCGRLLSYSISSKHRPPRSTTISCPPPRWRSPFTMPSQFSA